MPDVDIPAEGYAERFGEPLWEFDLPAAGGTVKVSKKTSLGPLTITVSGTFTITQAAPG